MTDEELRVRAIQELEFYKKDDTFILADITVDLAIKALEQMPVTTTAGEGGVIYYPQVEGVTPTVIDAGKQELCGTCGYEEGSIYCKEHCPHEAKIEQAPCGNAIDRNLVCAFIDGLISDDSERKKGLEYIRNMPPVNPTKTGWIPVRERLPEDIKPVIITWKNTDPKSYYQYIVGKHFIGTAHYKGGKWFWYSSVTEDLLAEYGRCDSEEFDEAIEVIAWMPLPEPYEPQERSGEE